MAIASNPGKGYILFSAVKNSLAINIKFNLSEIVQKIAEVQLEHEADSETKSPWQIAEVVLSLHGHFHCGMLKYSWEASSPNADSMDYNCVLMTQKTRNKQTKILWMNQPHLQGR